MATVKAGSKLTYIDVMTQLDGEYAGVGFIYYTGHTDGSQPGSDLWRHNNMVREHVDENGLILFDFADIESYDPGSKCLAKKNAARVLASRISPR